MLFVADCELHHCPMCVDWCFFPRLLSNNAKSQHALLQREDENKRDMAKNATHINLVFRVIQTFIRIFAIILASSIAVKSNGRCACSHNKPAGNGNDFNLIKPPRGPSMLTSTLVWLTGFVSYSSGEYCHESFTDFGDQNNPGKPLILFDYPQINSGYPWIEFQTN